MDRGTTALIGLDDYNVNCLKPNALNPLRLYY